MLGYFKETFTNYIKGLPPEEVLGMACLLVVGIMHTLRTKLLKTSKLIFKRLGGILAVLVVLPVTVIVIVLGVAVQLCAITLTVVTGLITLVILLINLVKDLLQDLTSYIVDNYEEDTNDR